MITTRFLFPRLTAVIALFMSWPTLAQDIFTVKDVPIDSRAATAREARDLAITSGREQAWQILVERLVPTGAQTIVPEFDSRTLQGLVRDFSLADEQQSAVRYLANMTVRFDPDLVRAELRGAQVPFSETQSRTMLILPVLQTSSFGSYVLWDDPNPWREAWDGLPSDTGLVPFELGLGDLEDFTSVTPQDALTRRSESMEFLRLKYGVGGVVVALAEVKDTFSGRQVEISLSIPRENGPAVVRQTTVDDPTAGAMAYVMGEAAVAARRLLEDDWKQRTQLDFGRTGLLTAIVPLSSLEDWLAVQDRLTPLPMVERVMLQAMTRDRAQVTVYFVGTQEQLELAMAQADLDLIWTTNVWTLSLATQRRTSTSPSAVGLR